ncbi:FKBP-type peptidyl-prolyl cis-trans isomerase [Daejeonella oryzae]|uniref:FKBP-type peptidyl-prolyl cis-trans isomerase n=1 Tax=Daejeonella oryzae TaxID=1122943 RepID=UPI000404DED2|nr:FKBP-type peptidyl-prolyl cis-trans isomerase [Daejeonella oryzae]
MKKIVIILGVAVLGLSSCKQFKKGEGDMMYKIHEDKSGETIKEGDFVAFNAIEKTEEDSVLYSSYDYDRPSLLVKEKSLFTGDLFAALGMLSEGDSATFKINIDSMVAKMGRPKPTNTKGKYLLYVIKVDKIIPKGKLTDSIFRGQIDTYLKAEQDKAKGAEGAKFNAYISKENLKPTVTASGLNYTVTKEGSGPKPVAGDTVLVNYTGKFLSGKVFDTSYPEIAKKAGTFNAQRPYEPLKMPVGMNGSIPGFEEGLMLFSKGTKATIILPSKLAYGEQGSQGIPPFTPLIFDIEMVNIIPAKPGSVSPQPAPVPAN